jgi:hypothetical protein
MIVPQQVILVQAKVAMRLMIHVGYLKFVMMVLTMMTMDTLTAMIVIALMIQVVQ